MREIGTLELSKQQQKLWRKGSLHRDWANRYPELFDEQDIGILSRTERQRQHHFAEWLTAIFLFHSTGFHALVEKYQFNNHPRKKEVVKRLGAKARRALDAIPDAEKRRIQGPDLLMFAPDYSSFFFCEVKGPGDALRGPQRAMIDRVEAATKQEVRLMSFDWNG